ncbi:MAG TPA: hypothetical protein DCG48_03735 [Rhodospirillaceae bacterium]|nr:hypothetical protein [Rhodospirillaceae bacterium]
MGEIRNALLNKKPEDALARRAAGLDRLITLGLLAAAGFLAAGIYLPVMVVSKLFIFSDQISIWSAIQELIGSDEIFLAAIVLIFSVIFPAAKVLVAYGLWRNISFEPERHRRAVTLLDAVARWSAADVLIVALLVVIAKSTALADAEVGIGLYSFAAGVVLTSLMVYRIKKAIARAAD